MTNKDYTAKMFVPRAHYRRIDTTTRDHNLAIAVSAIVFVVAMLLK